MNEVKVLKKLAGRRKMFEDYITLVKKPDRLRRGTWEVRREEPKTRESKMLGVRGGKWEVKK